MKVAGFMLFMLGAAGVDSPNMAVPATMVLSGLTILSISALLERRQYGLCKGK